MRVFTVQYDFSKCQPRWNATYKAWFGEFNEGKEVSAETPEDAIKQFATANNLNPFYLRVKP